MAMLNNQRVYGVIMYYLYMLAYAGYINPYECIDDYPESHMCRQWQIWLVTPIVVIASEGIL